MVATTKPEELTADQKRELLKQLLRKKQRAPRQDDDAERRARSDALQPVSGEDDIPASPAQERLWLTYQMEPRSPAYNLPIASRLSEALKTKALAQALESLRLRHDALSTTFRVEEERPVQVVDPSVRVPLRIVDLSRLPGSRAELEARRLAKAEVVRPFDLESGPLLRSVVLRGVEEHVLLLTLHHIVFDGASVAPFSEDLEALYEAEIEGRPADLPSLSSRYADFAMWQRRRLERGDLDEGLAWWREQLAGASPGELPTDRSRPEQPSFRSGSVALSLGRELSTEIKSLSRQLGVTRFVTLLTAYETLLLRHTGWEDWVVGSPVAERERPELAGLVGFFANTLALRSDLSGDPSFREAVRRVGEGALEAFAHREVPFEHVVQAVRPDRTANRNPLFRTTFALQETSLDVGLQLGELEAESVGFVHHQARFDLEAHLWHGEQGLEGVLLYDRDLFDESTITRLGRRFKTLLEAAVACPDERLSRLTLLDASERRQWKEQSVGEEIPPQTLPAHQRCLDSGKREDEALVMAERESWSRKALESRARAWSRSLRHAGAAEQDAVAVCLDGSAASIAKILGVLQAGGAVVALDADMPREHLETACRKTAVSWALAGGWRFPPGVPSVEVDDRVEDVERPEDVSIDSEALAWWSPTSGIGDSWVGVEHRGLQAALTRLQTACPLRPEDVVAVVGRVASMNDGGWKLLWPLAEGASLVMGKRTRAVAGRADVMVLAPEHAASLLMDLEAGAPPPRAVVVSGGPVSTSRAAALEAAGVGEIHHLLEIPSLGAVASRRMDPWGVEEADMVMPIGKPLPGSRLFVLDVHGGRVPTGRAGSLHVGAPPGWRFPEVRWQSAAGERCWASLQRGRWSAGGGLELLESSGRRAWLRGIEVDLEFLEGELLRQDPVAECRISRRVRSDGGRELVGYVVGSGPWTPESLDEHLAGRVPPAWRPVLPSFWVGLTSLPRTISGMVDEAALHRLPVVDEELVSRWESALASTPGVSEVAVVARRRRREPERYHVSRLPGGGAASGAESFGAAPEASSERSESSEDGRSGAPSLAVGGALRTAAEGGRVPEVPESLTAALERAAAWSQEEPSRGVTYVEGDSEEHQSYAELLAEAERVLGSLRSLELEPGEPVLLVLGTPREFLPVFWGAVLGGFVPVPVGVPPVWEAGRTEVEKVANAWRMLGEPPLVVEAEAAERARERLRAWGGADGGLVVSRQARGGPRDRRRSEGRGDDVALMLLTSGSTGRPKGVRQTHRAILRREAAMAACNGFGTGEVSLNWFPLDHVGGLVMFHVRDVYLGCRQVQGRMDAVLERPLVWLDWIDRYRATVTWAPNFAFGLVNERAAEIARGSWDLSSMRSVINGGEALVARTTRRFLELLAPHGLPSGAMLPVWGMSETCSGVVYSERCDRTTMRDDDEFVEVGRPVPEFSLRVVDTTDQVVPEGTVGRVQVQGPSVTTGYWENPEANRESFTADGWFVTGDLGVLRDGRLTITGREKDVIIVRGNNFYSHEIESVVEELEGVEVSYTAACGVRRGRDTDQLAIFFHPTAGVEGSAWVPLVRRIRQEVASRVGLSPEYLVPVERDEVPKTGIGKIQRRRLAESLESGDFDERLHRVDLALGNERTVPAWFHRRVWRRQAPAAPDTWPVTGRWILLGGDTELGRELESRMAARGAEVVSVEAGEGYERLGEDRVRLALGEPGDSRRLLEDVGPVTGIVHLWTWDGAADREPRDLDEDRDLERGTYSLLSLAHALASREAEGETLRLVVAARGAQAVDDAGELRPARAMLLAFLQTLEQELAGLRCRHVDLRGADAAVEAGHVLTELTSPEREPEVAWRHGDRWVPRLEAVDPRAGEPVAPEAGLVLERGGVYLVTGGLGGIGRRLARWLVDGWGARLLLVGRTELSGDGETDDSRTAERRAAWEALQRSAAGEVLYRTVDVVDGDGLAGVVAEAERRWGRPLDGVFHLAGAFEQRLLADTSKEDVERLLEVKRSGARRLHDLVRNSPASSPPFFVAFSSVNGTFGGATAGAYGVANGYLDAFCRRHSATGGVPTVSLAWSMWDDVGMSRDFGPKEVSQSQGFLPISTRPGLVSLTAALDTTIRGGGPSGHLLIGLDGTHRRWTSRSVQSGDIVTELTAFYTTSGPAGSTSPEAAAGRYRIRDAYGVATRCRLRQLDELPRNADGTVDLEHLESWTEAGEDRGHEYEAPRTPLERRVAEIWREVLNVSDVGIHANFFELGGHSLLATQVIFRLRRELEVDLDLHRLFRTPTIAGLAAVVEEQGSEETEAETIPTIERRSRRVRRVPVTAGSETP